MLAEIVRSTYNQRRISVESTCERSTNVDYTIDHKMDSIQ